MIEVKSLKKLNNHPNVIKVLEMIRKDQKIYIVMEFCEKELLKELMNCSKDNRQLIESDIKIIMGQAVSAINYLHKNNFMHRDIKPENFLLKESNSNQNESNSNLNSRGFNMQNYTLKLADFGASKDLSDSASSNKFTEYVGTRWYRAPELLLYSNASGYHNNHPYSQSIDIFALGCLMLELYLGIPAFPGNNESDQLNKIFSVLGTPS